MSEHSAGGVLLVPIGSQLLVALIRVRRGVLALPKGHVEPGELPPAAALRETREETGLSGRLIAPLGEISYRYWSRFLGTRVTKRVDFFLMGYRAGSPAHHDGESEAVHLVPAAAAPSQLAYPGERRVMRGALAWLETAGYGSSGVAISVIADRAPGPEPSPPPRGRPCTR